jgi:hypothetical protein
MKALCTEAIAAEHEAARRARDEETASASQAKTINGAAAERTKVGPHRHHRGEPRWVGVV